MTSFSFRRDIISKPIFSWAHGVLPAMSDTEREALEAGDVWWDADLFTGNPDWSKLLANPPATLTEEEQAFLNGPVDELCAMLDDWKINWEWRDLPQDVGFSFVELVHDTGQDQGQCESWGAGYWLGQEVEEGVLGAGAAPPDAGDVSGGYKNPTTSREVRPNLSAGQSESDRHPAVKNYFPPGNDLYAFPPNGPGYKWTAKCDNDIKGQGQGDVLNVGGFQAVGSTAEGAVDKATGVYTGSLKSQIRQR